MKIPNLKKHSEKFFEVIEKNLPPHECKITASEMFLFVKSQLRPLVIEKYGEIEYE